MIKDYTAIDFETANPKRWSACQIGITKVVDNKILSTECHMIDPETEIDYINNKIHKIKQEDVKGKPNFKATWEKIKHHFDDAPVVIAHGADFDISVLYSCLNRYQIAPPNTNYFCTYETLAALENLDVYQLEHLMEHYGIKSDDDFHNAGSDSLYCAKLMQIMSETYGDTLDQYINHSINISVDVSKYVPSRKNAAIRKFNVKPSDIERTVDTNEIDQSNPFFEKKLVITGDFSNHTRAELFQIIKNMGGRITTGVSKKTDYLLVGTADLTVVKDKVHGKSSKQLKAEKINECAECETDYVKIVIEEELISILDEFTD